MMNQEQIIVTNNDIKNFNTNQNISDPFPNMVVETEVSKLFNRCSNKYNSPLETNIPYIGTIREIVFRCDSYPRISIYIDINMNGTIKSVTEDYTFGGRYDEFYMDKLTSLLGNIRNYQLNWVNSQTYETITQSMQFLIGTEVKITQKLSQNNKTYNDISIIGEFNISQGRVINTQTN